MVTLTAQKGSTKIVETVIEKEIVFVVFADLSDLSRLQSIVKRCEEIEEVYMETRNDYAEIIIVDKNLSLQIELRNPNQMNYYNGIYNHMESSSRDINQVDLSKEMFFTCDIPYCTF